MKPCAKPRPPDLLHWSFFARRYSKFAWQSLDWRPKSSEDGPTVPNLMPLRQRRHTLANLLLKAAHSVSGTRASKFCTASLVLQGFEVLLLPGSVWTLAVASLPLPGALTQPRIHALRVGEAVQEARRRQWGPLLKKT